MQQEVETAALFAKVYIKIESELKKLSEQFAANLDKASEDIYQNLRAIQRMRARDQSDNDQRHKRNEDNILKHLEMLQDHATHFESLGTVTTMLVEGVNMQLEAELADLLDRSMTALYGMAQNSKKEEKIV